MEPKDAILNKEAEEKDNVRFKELKEKKQEELTPEENTEIGELKERYGQRMQKKIDQMHAKQKTLEEETERLRLENEELKSKTPEKNDIIPESLKEETVEFGGKKYFTDKALIAQVKSGEITEDEAYTYQRKRDKEEIKEDLRREHIEETKKEEGNRLRSEDTAKVLKEYPHFSKKNPDFDSEDPLYKLSNELYLEAYVANPKGLSLAIKRAKEILRLSDEKPDGSDDHEVESSEPSEKRPKEKEITLSEDEKESAVRMYTRGDVINPKTGRPYTVNEALVKGLMAKKNRRI